MAQTPPALGSLHEDPGLGPGFAPAASAPLDQPAPTPLSAPAARGTGFMAVEPRGEASSDAMSTLVVAYSLMWLILLGFIGLVARRQARTEARLVELERSISKSPPTP
jgi:hypothetical protein